VRDLNVQKGLSHLSVVAKNFSPLHAAGVICSAQRCPECFYCRWLQPTGKVAQPAALAKMQPWLKPFIGAI